MFVSLRPASDHDVSLVDLCGPPRSSFLSSLGLACPVHDVAPLADASTPNQPAKLRPHLPADGEYCHL